MNILLSNKQSRLGDALMLTPIVRDFKATYPEHNIDIESAIPQIWENNPHLTKFDKPDEIHYIGPTLATRSSKTNGLHITEGFRFGLESKTEFKIKQGLLKPEIFLSDIEKKKRIVDGSYWIIVPSHGIGYSSKEWVSNRWQKVIDALPWITFVQIGDFTNPFMLHGDNLINLVGKTSDYDIGIRDLFTLFYHCEGVVGLISAPMHIAAAFDKPAVIIAGAREPVTFEKYEFHQFISTIGCLPCAKTVACWANNKDSCFVKMYEAGIKLFPEGSEPENVREYAVEYERVKHVPACMIMISVEDVTTAITRYYKGGILKEASVKKSPAKLKARKIFRIISNGKFLGGAERSVLHICKMMQEEGYDVELATRKSILCDSMKEQLNGIKITDKITDPCDILMLYASDMVFDFDKDEFEVFDKLQADKKIMALTYKIGKTNRTEWTKGWDKYIFLNRELEKGFLNIGEANTKVLPPPVELDKFFNSIAPKDYGKLSLCRISSQGDKKYDPRLLDIIKDCPGLQFSFMPRPSFLTADFAEKYNVVVYGFNMIPVETFFSKANVFFYLLPPKYTEQGPRVIMEAMAAGLSVITENHSGMADRVNEETGWFVNYENCAEVIKNIGARNLGEKSVAARQFAKDNFNPYDWVKEIIG